MASSKVWSFPKEERGGVTALMLSIFLAGGGGEGGKMISACCDRSDAIFEDCLLMCLS